LLILVEQASRAYHARMTRLVKRYARSRLYDTQSASYVTVVDLRLWAARGVQFTVIDVETGDDITRILLA
jgi:polyhydroxyalkanoate synthesis regulator protein